MDGIIKPILTDEMAIIILESMIAAGNKSKICPLHDEDIDVLNKAIASIRGWRNVLKQIDDEIKEIEEHADPNDCEAQDIIFDYKHIRQLIVDEMIGVGL